MYLFGLLNDTPSVGSPLHHLHPRQPRSVTFDLIADELVLYIARAEDSLKEVIGWRMSSSYHVRITERRDHTRDANKTDPHNSQRLDQKENAACSKSYE